MAATLKYHFNRLLLLPVLLCLLLPAWQARAAGLDIYLVRHAETISNVTHAHDPYAENNFSERGERQLARLNDELKRFSFDAILVSPKQRTLKTILPYLREKHQVAEIWPELTECCWQGYRGGRGYLATDGRISLHPEQRPYFTFRDRDASYEYRNDSYADGMAQLRYAVELLHKRYFNSGKRILIVTHYHAGSRLMELLMGMAPEGRFKLSNGAISHLVEKADGSVELVELNGRPVSGRRIERPDLPWM